MSTYTKQSSNQAELEEMKALLNLLETLSSPSSSLLLQY